MTKSIVFKATTVELPGQGRRKRPILVDLYGDIQRAGAKVSVDTEQFRGVPIIEVANLVQGEGFDPSEAMIRGLNELKSQHARQSHPTVQQMILAGGYVSTDKEARVAAIHVAKVADIFHVRPEALLAELRERRDEPDMVGV
jgi:hypothetical protein